MLPRLTAPIASALAGRRPTSMVSTIPMLIQPSSAATSGPASFSMGRNSRRNSCLVCIVFWRGDSASPQEPITTDQPNTPASAEGGFLDRCEGLGYTTQFDLSPPRRTEGGASRAACGAVRAAGGAGFRPGLTAQTLLAEESIVAKTHFSTQSSPPAQNARFSRTHEDQGRTQSPGG